MRCKICDGWLEQKRDGSIPDMCEYCRKFKMRLIYFLNELEKK